MTDFLSQWISKEALKHPALIILLIIAASGAAGFMANPFVLAEDYDKFKAVTERELGLLKNKMGLIDNSLCALQYSGQVNAIEQQIVTVEQEVYDLQRRESSGQAEQRDLERLDGQKSRLQQLQRKMDDLKRRGCQ